MKQALIGVVALAVIGLLAFIFLSDRAEAPTPAETPDVAERIKPVENVDDDITEAITVEQKPVESIGTSAGSKDITAYHFGEGDTEVMFVGGIHGGYSFNTALVGFEIIDYLKANPSVIPENVMVTVIPVLNPDGLEKIVGTTGTFDGSKVTTNDETRVPGRFNANNVDINRNFDCEWKSDATWQDRKVSGGSAPFSESESQAIRNYVESQKPAAVVAYYSQAGGVYASTCNNGILPETTALTNLYAKAAGYPAFEKFDYYEVTGDMVNWVAGQGIPAISVLLSNHEEAEWSKNQKGVDAILQHFAE